MRIALRHEVWFVALLTWAALGCQAGGSPGGGGYITYVCGNGVCEGTENDYCAKDCAGACAAPCSAAVCTAAGEIQDCITNQAGCKVLAAPKACGGGKTCVGSECIVPSQVSVCGDQKCDPGESYATCSKDCSATGPVCGDLKCEPGESYATCSKDCPAAAPVCGDFKCEAGENSSNCSKDCPVTGPVCGNGKCESGESSANCSLDCPVVGHVCDSYCGQMGPGGCYCDAGCAKSGDCCTYSGGKPVNANGDCDGSTCALCQSSKTLRYVTIDGGPEGNPDCMSSSPGADIDVVALYSAQGNLRGVGKPGTVVHKEGATPACPGGWFGGCVYGKIGAYCHNDPSDVAGGMNTKMYSDSTPDTGYFALSKGTLQLQFGACTVSTNDIKQCNGAGPVLDILPGDEIDLYEVDGSYKAGSGSGAAGVAPASCICKAEAYEVFVSAKPGTGLQSLGQFTGSKGAIKVY